MNKFGDVIIVGGGVIGLTSAYFLARENVRVVVCDQGTLGMEASWAGAGILPPSDLAHASQPLDRLRALSGQLFPDLSAELRERTGIDNGFRQSGGLEFVSQVGAADPLEWYGLGIPTKLLAEAEVNRLEPALAPHLGDAIHLPTMAQLRNPRHLQALRGACLATGRVSFLEGDAVQEVVVASGRVRGVRTTTETIQAESVLLAAGAWTAALLAPLGCRLAIEPVRGQIVLLKAHSAILRHILLWGSRYLVPREDGRILIGSTEEHVGFDRQTTARGVHGLLSLAIQLVPALANVPVEKSWAGLRPGSRDGLPYIGNVPDIAGLHVAAGHFRAGITLSPGTALLVKEMILGRPLSLPADAFRLDRSTAD